MPSFLAPAKRSSLLTNQETRAGCGAARKIGFCCDDKVVVYEIVESPVTTKKSQRGRTICQNTTEISWCPICRMFAPCTCSTGSCWSTAGIWRTRWPCCSGVSSMPGYFPPGADCHSGADHRHSNWRIFSVDDFGNNHRANGIFLFCVFFDTSYSIFVGRYFRYAGRPKKQRV